jgi:ubiquinone biosynthesis protein UbiJ
MSLTSEVILTLTETLETSINLVLKRDPQTLEKFAALQGKILAFEITDLDLTLYLYPHTEGVQIQYICEDQPDTTLQGSTLAFINMSLGDASDSFFSGEVRIKGDIELGQKFKRILDRLDLDWEEWLAGYTGDLIAFKAGSLLRGLNAWGKDTFKTIQLDAREYIQDEGGQSPHAEEVQDFASEISELRDQTARLEARILRLQKKLQSPV